MREAHLNRLFTILLFILLPLVSSAKCLAQNEHTEIRIVVDRLFEAMRTGDSASVRSVFLKENSFTSISKNSSDSVIVRSEGNADGFIKAVGTPHKEAWNEKIYNVTINTDGPMAVVWAPYRFFLGETFSHCGVNVFILVKAATGWKIKEITDTRRKTDCS